MESAKPQDEESDSEDEDEPEQVFGHVTAHGKKGKGGGIFTLAELEARKEVDIAYRGFTSKLEQFCKGFMETNLERFPRGPQSFDGFSKETQKVRYTNFNTNSNSMSVRSSSTDHLRCTTKVRSIGRLQQTI